MHVADDTIVGGVRQPIRDVEKLLAIPDDVFRTYSESQKRNLVVQSSTSGALTYDSAEALTNPPPPVWKPAGK